MYGRELMEESLRSEIMEALLADEDVDELVSNLVDAACESDEAIAAVLNGEKREPRKPSARVGEPPGAYVEEISVSGFRGVGPRVNLKLEPGPGLTVIFGRNGSGKSSFSEGLETLLTGSCSRFIGRRSKLWEKGWRNLHNSDKARVEAKLTIEGQQPLHIVRSWKKDADLEESQVDARYADKTEVTLESLGFPQALAEFRPFLSHPELGALVEEPSKAHDLLNQVLSLDEVVAAIARLTKQRKELSSTKRSLNAERKQLRDAAEELEDERAGKCAKLLAKTKPDLDKLEGIVLGTQDDEAETRLKNLGRVTKIAMPTNEEFEAAKTALVESKTAYEAASTDAAESHASLIEVLTAAKTHLEQHAEECPVCERPMDAAKITAVDERLASAKEASTRFREAKRGVRRARDAAETLCGRLPQKELELAFTLELIEDPAPLLAYAKEKVEAHDELLKKLEELPKRARPIVDASAVAAREAAEKIESVFRPFATTVAAYISRAKTFEPRLPHLKPLDSAEKWLDARREILRDARFDPIVDRAKEIWAMLSAQSFVSLDDISLAGKKNQRRVEFSAHVDNNEAEALSVMSQGELNALALSIFIPRMCHASSPFRFLVIDDPVQAMDPHKVDGLARVLDEVARTRQVIVLTHDGRLVSAIRRLQINATVHQVTRRPESVVDVRVTHEAVTQLIDDAWQVLGSESELGEDVCARVVPAFCRAAIDAACEEAFRRRRLKRGDEHEEVEKVLAKSRTTHAKAALAMFDDTKHTGDVKAELTKELSEATTTAYIGVLRAAHGSYEGDLRALIGETKKLTKFLRGRA